MNSTVSTCELCSSAGGAVILHTPTWRVVRVDDPDYPGFCRVILNAHVREMSDLQPAERQLLMSVVFAVEETIRSLFQPDKINLASFGNMVPHVHWHIIPRWNTDRHFPEPIWGNVHNQTRCNRAVVSNELLASTLRELLSAQAIALGKD